MELGLQCHQVFSLFFVRLTHGALGMFDFIFLSSGLHG